MSIDPAPTVANDGALQQADGPGQPQAGATNGEPAVDGSGAGAGALRPTIECAAYSLPLKIVATLFVGALVFAAWRAAGDLASAAWTAPAKASLAVLGIGVAVGYGWILGSRTSIDATHITQTWLWPKHVRLADITQAKLVYLPALSWIIAPRLVVRARGRRTAMVFPAAGREVLAEFARLTVDPMRG